MIEKIMKLYRKYAVWFYFKIRKMAGSRKQRQILFLVLSPILLIVCAWNFLFERMGKKICIDKCNDLDKNKHFSYDLIFVAIAKNEGSYIEEWIEYHRLVGVQKFIIYDNGSTDNMKEVLQPYIVKGIVDYVFLPGRAKQLDAYYDALLHYRKKAKLIGFFDLDEFVISVDKNKMLPDTVWDILQKYNKAAGVAINWYVYGSSGHKHRPQGLVTENYLYRAEDAYENNRCVKTIVNPRMVKGYIFDPHTPTYYCGYHSVTEKGHVVDGPWNEYPNNSYDKIRINHYYCKSVDEGKIKFERGLATHEQDIKNDWEKYARFDKNDIYDDIMMQYVEKIWQALRDEERG